MSKKNTELKDTESSSSCHKRNSINKSGSVKLWIQRGRQQVEHGGVFWKFKKLIIVYIQNIETTSER